jgi:hypothetical protein
MSGQLPAINFSIPLTLSSSFLASYLAGSRRVLWRLGGSLLKSSRSDLILPEKI